MKKNIRLVNELLELDFEPIKEWKLWKEVKKQIESKGRSGDNSIDKLKENLHKEFEESFDKHKQNILLRFKKTIKYEFSKQENKTLLDNIKSGLWSNNSDIKLLQESLNKLLKSNIAEDGKIWPETIWAIRKFQKNNWLDADGIVWNKTLSKIDNLLASTTEENTSMDNNNTQSDNKQKDDDNKIVPSNQDSNYKTVEIGWYTTYNSLDNMLSNSKVDQPISINNKLEWIKNMKWNSTTEYQYTRPNNLNEPLPQEGTYTIDPNTNTISYQDTPNGKVEFKLIKKEPQNGNTKESDVNNSTDDKTINDPSEWVELLEEPKTLREIYKAFISEISWDIPLTISMDGRSLNMNLDNSWNPYYKRWDNNSPTLDNNSLPTYGLYKINETYKIITWSGKKWDELKFEKIWK